jgi:predicted anti-sigma-YlaC factor YlaD
MCPDREILSAYLDGEVRSTWEGAIAEHVALCESCRAVLDSLQTVRRSLRGAPDVPWEHAMERVRLGLLVSKPPASRKIAVWRKQVALPVPVAVLAAALLLTLGVAVAVLAARTSFGYVRVTRAPSGTEFQFAVPYDKVESLLKSVGGTDSSVESVMTLPKNVNLVPVGEPKMIKAADVPRKK